MFVTTTHTKAMHEKWKENKHNPYFILTGRKWIKETSGKAMSEDKEKLWWCSFQHIEKMLSKNVKIHRNIEKSTETAQGWRCCHWFEPCFSPPPLPGRLTVFFTLHTVRASLTAVPGVWRVAVVSQFVSLLGKWDVIPQPSRGQGCFLPRVTRIP